MSFLVRTLSASSADCRAGSALSSPAWHSAAMALASSASLPILIASAFTCRSHTYTQVDAGLSDRATPAGTTVSKLPLDQVYMGNAIHIWTSKTTTRSYLNCKACCATLLSLPARSCLHRLWVTSSLQQQAVRQTPDLLLLLISNTLVLDNGHQQLLTAGLGLCYHYLLVLAHNLQIQTPFHIDLFVATCKRQHGLLMLVCACLQELA